MLTTLSTPKSEGKCEENNTRRVLASCSPHWTSSDYHHPPCLYICVVWTTLPFEIVHLALKCDSSIGVGFLQKKLTFQFKCEELCSCFKMCGLYLGGPSQSQVN